MVGQLIVSATASVLVMSIVMPKVVAWFPARTQKRNPNGFIRMTL